MLTLRISVVNVLLMHELMSILLTTDVLQILDASTAWCKQEHMSRLWLSQCVELQLIVRGSYARASAVHVKWSSLYWKESEHVSLQSYCATAIVLRSV